MDTPEEDAMEKRLVEAAIRALIQSGDIDPRGKTRRQIMTDIAALMKEREINWETVIDHKSELLQRAHELRARGSGAEAIVLYATWIEHALNLVIKTCAARSGLSDQHVLTLLKDTQIRAKFVWVHLLLSLPLAEEQAGRVGLIHSVRNEFIHYKWTPTEDRDESRLKGALEAVRFVEGYLDSIIQQYVDLGYDHTCE